MKIVKKSSRERELEKQIAKVQEEEILQQKYVDILSNGGFKAVFGDRNNKRVIMDILNTLLPEHRQLEDIELVQTEYRGHTEDSKEYRYDFMCRDINGVSFIVEAQKYHDDNWFKRCVSYTSRIYDMQNQIGQDYVAKPVYLIGLMGVEIEHPEMELWKDKYVSEYTFREKETQELLDETIFIIFAEVARFNKQMDECGTDLEKMLYLLKNSGEILQPSGWMASEKYTRIMTACEIGKFSKMKRLQYIKDMMAERSRVSEMNTAIRRGRDEGRAEGRAEERLNTAAKMKELGVDVAIIYQVTGLSEEDIADL